MTVNGVEDGAGRPGAGIDAYAARLREVQEAVLAEERQKLLEAARLLAGSYRCTRSWTPTLRSSAA